MVVGMTRLAVGVTVARGVVVIVVVIRLSRFRHDSPPSGEVRVDDLDQLLRGLGAWIAARYGGIDDMFADVMLDNFRNQSIESAPARSDLLQNRCTFGIHLHRTLHGFQLAADPSDPGQQLLLLSLGV